MNTFFWALVTLLLAAPIGCTVFLLTNGAIGSKELMPLVFSVDIGCAVGFLSALLMVTKES